MLAATKYALLVLLFLLTYMSIHHLLRSWVRAYPSERSRKRLKTGNRHLNVLLRSAQVKLNPPQFILFSLIAGAAGAAAGTFYFSSLKGVLVLGLIMLSSPYFWLRSRLISLQMKHRIDFLPAVEGFYQMYVLSDTKNIRTVIQASLAKNRLPYAVHSIFEQLYVSLMVHRDNEECLREFAFALGSRYAEQFAAMLRLAIEEGADLSAGLRELIDDMRTAMRTDHADRNRLLEIRIANFSPLFFLAVFLFVNAKIDPEQAYRYYVLSETGKDMLLDALLLIGASFVMGLYLSLRRI